MPPTHFIKQQKQKITKFIGAHMSIAGGLYKAIQAGQDIK
jgi:hypothetical protein